MKRTARTLALLAALGVPMSIAAAPALAQDAVADKKAPHIDKEAEKVWDRYVELTLGELAEDPDAVDNVVLEGSMSMPQMGINAPITLTMVPGTGMTMQIEIPNLDTITQGFYKGTAWGKSMMQGANIMTGPEADQLAEQADMLGVADWSKYNDAVYYRGIETIELHDGNETETHVLEVDTKRSESNTMQYYSVESGLLLKSVTNIVLPGGQGEAPSTQYMTDYREVDGLMFPYTTIAQFGPQEQTVAFDSVTVNADLGDDAITPPQDILDMIED